MPKLGLNIDHVATLRQVRKSLLPDLAFAAYLCEAAGAQSIVVHLREDRRHIQDKDVLILRQKIKTKLNLEMSISPEILKIACKIKPDKATLVPEKRKELTTEGGLDVLSNFKKVSDSIARLKKAGIEVSLFIDPDLKQIDAAKKSGAKIIELHTGKYANAKNFKQKTKFLNQIKIAVKYAKENGFIVNVGHGLDYSNVTQIAKIKGIHEFNIGYSVICKALYVGLYEAVKEMRGLIK
jgi:pyridoxine 5-phosphate synthase